jgi:hypothetical protein
MASGLARAAGRLDLARSDINGVSRENERFPSPANHLFRDA